MKTEADNRKSENRGTKDTSTATPEGDLTNKQQKIHKYGQNGTFINPPPAPPHHHGTKF